MDLEKWMQLVLDCLNKHQRGFIIKQMINEMGVHRNTITPALKVLVYTNQVEEIIYGQNTKVYFANVKKIKQFK